MFKAIYGLNALPSSATLIMLQMHSIRPEEE
jgi:hypothetical protein